MNHRTITRGESFWLCMASFLMMANEPQFAGVALAVFTGLIATRSWPA